MSAIGTGYDLSASQFSPDGRVFQVEYAHKAVENSGTAIAMKCKDGVVLAVEKLVTSKLYEPGTNRRIFMIDNHITAAVAGLLADARSIIERAREEAHDYRSSYGAPIPIHYLKNRVSAYMHAYTLYSFLRPFGCSVIFAAHCEFDGPQLFCVDPSGVAWGYKGCAVGKNKQSAKTEMEKIKFGEMTMRELTKQASRIIHIVHDDMKDKAFELELGWVGKETNGLHQVVPDDVHREAVTFAQESLKQQSDSEEESAAS